MNTNNSKSENASLPWALAVLKEAGWILTGNRKDGSAVYAHPTHCLEKLGASNVGPKAFFLATEANIIAQAEAEARRLENLRNSHALA